MSFSAEAQAATESTAGVGDGVVVRFGLGSGCASRCDCSDACGRSSGVPEGSDSSPSWLAGFVGGDGCCCSGGGDDGWLSGLTSPPALDMLLRDASDALC